jgi:acetyl-CoA C-acetyltransferase
MMQSTEKDVVIVKAVRSPIGRKNGSLSDFHAIDLLGTVLRQLVQQAGIEPAEVGQVIGGCVGQVGMQSMNVTRNSWLAAGLPMTVPATTIDTQCGSSQQAVNIATALIASGVVDVAIGCGVEVMSRVPMGSTTPKRPCCRQGDQPFVLEASRIHHPVRSR